MAMVALIAANSGINPRGVQGMGQVSDSLHARRHRPQLRRRVRRERPQQPPPRVQVSRRCVTVGVVLQSAFCYSRRCVTVGVELQSALCCSRRFVTVGVV